PSCPQSLNSMFLLNSRKSSYSDVPKAWDVLYLSACQAPLQYRASLVCSRVQGCFVQNSHYRKRSFSAGLLQPPSVFLLHIAAFPRISASSLCPFIFLASVMKRTSMVL